MVTTGQKFEGFFESLGSLTQPFAIRIFANQGDHLAHQRSDVFLFSLWFRFVQQQLFAGLFHRSSFSAPLATGTLAIRDLHTQSCYSGSLQFAPARALRAENS